MAKKQSPAAPAATPNEDDNELLLRFYLARVAEHNPLGMLTYERELKEAQKALAAWQDYLASIRK